MLFTDINIVTAEQLTLHKIAQFRRTIYHYYDKNKRELPWRQTSNPYHILISEIMLQQTQSSRVLIKYDAFIREFPDFTALACAPLRKVLQAWQGLGYNRRALALHRIAQTVVSDFNGELPSSPMILSSLPGIGSYTASAIAVFAFNKPAIFIETNIRTVFLHFFFPHSNNVADRDILPLIALTLDKNNTREWYYALFDYGVMLKKKGVSSGKSDHYHKQSYFQGSNRQLRGEIIRLLLTQPSLSPQELAIKLEQHPRRIQEILQQLQRDGFVKITRNKASIR